MTPIQRIQHLDKDSLKAMHRQIWSLVSAQFGDSLVWGIGEDGKVYVNLSVYETGKHRIYRLDGSERGLSTGTIFVELVDIYKRSSYAHRRFCTLVSNEVQVAVHQAYMNFWN